MTKREFKCSRRFCYFYRLTNVVCLAKHLEVNKAALENTSFANLELTVGQMREIKVEPQVGN